MPAKTNQQLNLANFRIFYYGVIQKHSTLQQNIFQCLI